MAPPPGEPDRPDRLTTRRRLLRPPGSADRPSTTARFSEPLKVRTTASSRPGPESVTWRPDRTRRTACPSQNTSSRWSPSSPNPRRRSGPSRSSSACRRGRRVLAGPRGSSASGSSPARRPSCSSVRSRPWARPRLRPVRPPPRRPRPRAAPRMPAARPGPLRRPGRLRPWLRRDHDHRDQRLEPVARDRRRLDPHDHGHQHDRDHQERRDDRRERPRGR